MAYDEKTVREADEQALKFAAKDIRDVIAIQEVSERLYRGSCPNIGRYYDELYLVETELRRRKRMDSVELPLTRAEARTLLFILGNDKDIDLDEVDMRVVANRLRGLLVHKPGA